MPKTYTYENCEFVLDGDKLVITVPNTKTRLRTSDSGNQIVASVTTRRCHVEAPSGERFSISFNVIAK